MTPEDIIGAKRCERCPSSYTAEEVIVSVFSTVTYLCSAMLWSFGLTVQ